jgi:uncharacterized protein (DUF1501 family)
MFSPHNASNSAATIWELDLTLAGGRLSSHSRAILTEQYEAALRETGPIEALKVAQQLLAVSPEFHTNTQPLTQPRAAATLPPQQSRDRPYKAIVVLYFSGGADSFNFVVPHSGCGDGSHTSYEQYELTRTGAALTRDMLLPIQVANGSQACSTFGLHPNLPFVQQLYEGGEAAIHANIGNLIEPIANRRVYSARTRRRPGGLYSHEHQQLDSKNLHPQVNSARGVLGKVMDVLSAGPTRRGRRRIAAAQVGRLLDLSEPRYGAGRRAPAALDRSIARCGAVLRAAKVDARNRRMAAPVHAGQRGR